MDHIEFLKHSFKEAIKFEQYGREFFLKAANEAKNPLAKEIFSKLAEEELKHIKRIKDVFDALTQNNKWPDQTPISENLPWKHIFKEALNNFNKMVNPSTSDSEALQLGLDFESKGYKFYNEMVQKSINPVEKSFFEFLRDEEQGHYLIIQNLKKYMENPLDWYGEEEHHIFEG